MKPTATLFAFATMFTVACHGSTAEPRETITPEIIAAIESQALIVDVRTPEEFADGHYPGAINIPHDTILGGLEQLGVTEETPVILYCRSGNRSGQAEQALHPYASQLSVHPLWVFWVAALVSGFGQAGELRQRVLWQSIDTLTVLRGAGAIKLRIETIGITAVPGRHNLPRHASDH